MAIISFTAISSANARNPDGSLIGRLSLVVELDNVSLALTTARIHNTTGQPQTVTVGSHAITAPHSPTDAEQAVGLGAFFLLATLSGRGLRPGFSG